MGIKQLSKVLEQHAKKSMKTRNIEFYTGYKVAIDASLAIYQFIIAVRSGGAGLSTSEGETTSHLVGLFHRTIRLLSSGIKPIYIFDGLPPQLKQEFELVKRREKRDEAIKEYLLAVEEGDQEKMEKYDKRQTKVSKKHVEDCQQLLKLMNIPFFIAESEAEAFASFLCKEGIVDAVATEDMDALTFGCPILLRNMNAAESKKLSIVEYDLKSILTEMDFSYEQFIDLCILLGCDYIPSMKGIGPKKAYDLVKKHKSIENILKWERSKLEKDNTKEFLENWRYEEARKVFNELSTDKFSNLIKIPKFDFSSINEQNLIEFLVEKNNFNKERVVNAIEKLKKIKMQSKQITIGSFFQKIKKTGS